MPFELLKHQQEFVDECPRKTILAWGTRVGKSYTICFWMKNFPNVEFILVCPKRIKKQWEDLLAECGVLNAVVMTKEEIKKTDISQYGGLVFDEAHHVASGLYKPHKTSQLTRTVYNWVRNHPEAPVLLATATPICSNPSNLHTLAALTGRYWDPIKYRDHFYRLVRRPYVPRPFWEPKKEWRKEIVKYAKKVCHIKRLSDIVEVPEQRHRIEKVKLSKETLQAIDDFADESVSKEWYGKHRLEQGKEKLAKIRELSADEPKVIIVCKYLEQIDYYAKELAKEREVVVLMGKTKNQEEAIARAQEMTEGYFIIQADAGEGFSGHDFSMLFFASMSFKYVSYEQMLGRMQHLKKKRANDYYYLIAGDKDKKIYDRIREGRDFSIAGVTETKGEA